MLDKLKCELSVKWVKNTFQQTLNVYTDSDGLGWVELQMDSLQALWVMSVVVLILLSAICRYLWSSLKRSMKDILRKESTFRLQRNLTYSNFKVVQTHNWIFVQDVKRWKNIVQTNIWDSILYSLCSLCFRISSPLAFRLQWMEQNLMTFGLFLKLNMWGTGFLSKEST